MTNEEREERIAITIDGCPHLPESVCVAMVELRRTWRGSRAELDEALARMAGQRTTNGGKTDDKP